MAGPATSERFISLQILRFTAALAVVVTHLPGTFALASGAAIDSTLTESLHTGFAGVDVFFVLSGFVIALTGPLAAPKPTGLLFFWRRWRRVAPVYFLISAPLVIQAMLAGDLRTDKIAATFLFWPAAGSEFARPYLDVGWSLCFELAFYSTVALMLLGGKLRRNLMIGGGALAIALTLRAATGLTAFRFLTSPLFLEFGAGMALAANRRRLAGAPVFAGMALLVAGGGAFALEAALGGARLGQFTQLDAWSGNFWRVATCGGPGAALVAGCVIVERACGGRFARLLAIGGDASYSIYLSQIYFLDALAVAWRMAHGPASFALFSAVGALTAVAGGLYVWRIIEKPLLRIFKTLRLPRVLEQSPLRRNRLSGDNLL